VFALCWRCANDDQLKAEYERGYDDGQRDAGPRLDQARIRQLLQLAHPDKHNGSAAANDATRWLLEKRDALQVCA
jgi:hypothetical protein